MIAMHILLAISSILLLDERSIDLIGAQERRSQLGLSLIHSKGFLDDGEGMACDTSFRSSQKDFIMKVTFFLSWTTEVD